MSLVLREKNEDTTLRNLAFFATSEVDDPNTALMDLSTSVDQTIKNLGAKVVSDSQNLNTIDNSVVGNTFVKYGREFGLAAAETIQGAKLSQWKKMDSTEITLTIMSIAVVGFVFFYSLWLRNKEGENAASKTTTTTSIEANTKLQKQAKALYVIVQALIKFCNKPTVSEGAILLSQLSAVVSAKKANDLPNNIGLRIGKYIEMIENLADGKNTKQDWKKLQKLVLKDFIPCLNAWRKILDNEIPKNSVVINISDDVVEDEFLDLSRNRNRSQDPDEHHQ